MSLAIVLYGLDVKTAAVSAGPDIRAIPLVTSLTWNSISRVARTASSIFWLLQQISYGGFQLEKNCFNLKLSLCLVHNTSRSYAFYVASRRIK